jgi:hypothetical protein
VAIVGLRECVGVCFGEGWGGGVRVGRGCRRTRMLLDTGACYEDTYAFYSGIWSDQVMMFHGAHMSSILAIADWGFLPHARGTWFTNRR